MKPPAPPPTPTEPGLRDAALRHLARYATTRQGLLRVLARRVERWARSVAPPPEAVAAAMQAAEAVVARLAEAGAVNDEVFAAGRARSLHRAGRSRRAITAHLQARGVSPDLAALPDDPAHEWAAAMIYARKRRIGPFRQPADGALRQQDLARLARAGFPAAVATRLLRLSPEEAEEQAWSLRRDLGA